MHTKLKKEESHDKYKHKYAGPGAHRSPESKKLPVPDLTSFSPAYRLKSDGSNKRAVL